MNNVNNNGTIVNNLFCVVQQYSHYEIFRINGTLNLEVVNYYLKQQRYDRFELLFRQMDIKTYYDALAVRLNELNIDLNQRIKVIHDLGIKCDKFSAALQLLKQKFAQDRDLSEIVKPLVLEIDRQKFKILSDTKACDYIKLQLDQIQKEFNQPAQNLKIFYSIEPFKFVYAFHKENVPILYNFEPYAQIKDIIIPQEFIKDIETKLLQSQIDNLQQAINKFSSNKNIQPSISQQKIT